MTPRDGDGTPLCSDDDAALQQQRRWRRQLTEAGALQEELERRVLATRVPPGEDSGGGVPALLDSLEAGLRLREKKGRGTADR